MTNETGPRDRLDLSRDLARRVRSEQRMTWFPLLVFAVITFAAAPVSRAGHVDATACRTVHRGDVNDLVCVAHNSATFVYWPIAIGVAYLVIGAFYAYRSRARGLGTRVRTYVIAGVVIAAAVTLAAVWATRTPPIGTHDLLGWHVSNQDLYRLVGPACAIGIGLLVLAAIERSPGLVAVTVAYLVIALVPIDFGWTIAAPSRWAVLPRDVINGAVLLAGAIAFAAVQRPSRRDPVPVA